MEQTPLSDILNEEEPAVEAEAPAEVQTEPSAEERPRDEHGRFISKGEDTGQDPDPSASPAPKDTDVPVGALTGERQRRQQAEQRAAELEARLGQYDAYYAQQKAQPQQIPDMFEDPEGFKAHLAAEIREELKQELQPSIQGNSMVTHARFCEMLARRDHEDYDQTVEVFKEELAVNPHLLTQLQKSEDPAMYAYNVGKQVQAARSYGTEAPPSRDELKAQLREELIQELGLQRQTAPTTHAADRSVGARSGPAWSGPAPLSDLLS